MNYLIIITLIVLFFLFASHFISYRLLKNFMIKHKKYGLNICCGNTSNGSVNADIVKHSDVPNFILIENIYKLPFQHHQFDTVLCSHTMEHVDDPESFYSELKRVGKQITIIIPPIWDIAAMLNVFEHKWIFLTFRKKHINDLPRRIRLPFSQTIQKWFGQSVKA